MAINCILLEDQPHSSQLLESHIYKLPSLNMVQVCQDFDTLEAALNTLENIEILFLVVETLDATHYTFLDTLSQRPFIIVHSGNEHLAVEAFKLQVVDFLPVPLDFEGLSTAVKRVLDLTVDPSLLDGWARKKYFFVKSDYKIIKINFADILYIEGMGEYVRIYTPAQKVITLLSLTKLAKILPPSFIRTHRSYIINLDKVDFIQTNSVI
ncbi:MAG: response regulator transcription factor, partial [Saprospiraceae bacterium]|nr:response regulator transcription factor [Saprospiraceae bacterium]